MYKRKICFTGNFWTNKFVFVPKYVDGDLACISCSDITLLVPVEKDDVLGSMIPVLIFDEIFNFTHPVIHVQITLY